MVLACTNFRPCIYLFKQNKMSMSFWNYSGEENIAWIYGEREASATLPVKKLHVYSSLSLFEKTLLLSFKVCAFLKKNVQTFIFVFQHLARSNFNLITTGCFLCIDCLVHHNLFKGIDANPTKFCWRDYTQVRPQHF